MIRDPQWEVMEVALRTPDDAGPGDLVPADVAALHLARRRFGVALPPPYAPAPADPARLPLRPAGPADAAALAVIQRRAFRHRYPGLLPDDFLAALDFSYLAPYWRERLAVASPGGELLVAGRPGEAYGMIDARAVAGDEGDGVGEVRSVYIDPTVFGRGLGSVLLRAAVDVLVGRGLAEAVLWVVEGNTPARAFYERWGWRSDGARKVTPVAEHVLHEVRYRRILPRAG